MDKTINQTTDYLQFSFLNANRDLVEGHLDRLDKEFEEYGNITKVSPITVNEHMQVIDGQHRLEVCTRRKLTVYYIVTPGLTIKDAQRINVTQRRWSPDDYAKSYATEGNKDYQMYIQLKEDYSAPHIMVLEAAHGGADHKGMHRDFLDGNFEIDDLEVTKGLLDVYTTVKDLTHIREASFYRALWRVSRVEGYEHKRMIQKLAQFGEQLYKPFASTGDNMRQLEEIYNYKQNESTRLRLY